MDTRTDTSSAPTVGSEDERFAFGDNWQRFLRVVGEERIGLAQQSLQRMLEVDTLEGKRFLDIGCGSGIFSLAAARLGAAGVHSFDFDPDSVAATCEVKSRFLPRHESWTIERGDVLDIEYLHRLGPYEVVYAWGVLHHTGAMWDAMDNVCQVCAPGGKLFLALYNDQGRRSRIWRAVKRLYNRCPSPVRPVVAAIVTGPRELRAALVATLSLKPGGYLRSWRQPDPRRAMSRWHNIIDWVGGYPFEVARPEQVIDFARRRGFGLVKLRTVGGAAGCNEYVFERSASPS